MSSSSATDGSPLLQCSATWLDSGVMACLSVSLAGVLVWTAVFGLGRILLMMMMMMEMKMVIMVIYLRKLSMMEIEMVMMIMRMREQRMMFTMMNLPWCRSPCPVFLVAIPAPALLLPGQGGGHGDCLGPAPPDNRGNCRGGGRGSGSKLARHWSRGGCGRSLPGFRKDRRSSVAVLARRCLGGNLVRASWCLDSSFS